ncbi:hypothetical protein ACEPAG_9182 [Sanghuangporus baumii]
MSYSHSVKGKSKATPNEFSAETSSSLDFLNMADDELFGAPDDNPVPVKIKESLDRLEGLLQPVEYGFDVSLNLSKPPSETVSDPICGVQSAEIIASLSIDEFMDLLKRYAFYITGERFEFDRFTGEPVMTDCTLDEPLGGETDEHPVKDSASRSEDEALAEREETPALALASSASPPSEGLISTPPNGGPSIVQVEQHVAQTDRTQNATDLKPSSLRARKRKRDNHMDDPRSSGSDDGCNSNGTVVGRGNTRKIKGKAKITGSNPLSTDFIIYRFGLPPVVMPIPTA